MVLSLAGKWSVKCSQLLCGPSTIHLGGKNDRPLPACPTCHSLHIQPRLHKVSRNDQPRELVYLASIAFRVNHTRFSGLSLLQLRGNSSRVHSSHTASPRSSCAVSAPGSADRKDFQYLNKQQRTYQTSHRLGWVDTLITRQIDTIPFPRYSRITSRHNVSDPYAESKDPRCGRPVHFRHTGSGSAQ